MRLWLVTTGWLGNGQEGVLVDAVDEAAACDGAAAALKVHHDARLAGPHAPVWMAQSHAKHIADLTERDGWTAEPIALPYVGEFS